MWKKNVHERQVWSWLAAVKSSLSLGSEQGTMSPRSVQSRAAPVSSGNPQQKQPLQKQQADEGQEKVCLFASPVMYTPYTPFSSQAIGAVVLVFQHFVL